MSTLVVIDMQKSFSAANDPKVVKHVRHQIKLAKARKAGIVLVRYTGSGNILDPILKSVGRYSKATTIIKRQDDGSREVAKAIKKNGFSNKIRVCGVNTGYCVLDTVIGLLKKNTTKVEVPKSACGSYNEKSDEWFQFPKDSRIVYL